MHSSEHPSSSSITTAAAEWLARRDRGLSAAEQDAYLQWLREKPAHAAEITRLEQSWHRLNELKRWKPAHHTRPDPDLLAPPRRRGPFWGWSTVITVAAVIAVGLLLGLPRLSDRAHRADAVVKVGPQRVALEDGSLLELNTGAAVEVQFAPSERRVQLFRGEAHFVVAKDPSRPFFVATERFAVRAVGTAFAVRFEDEALSVLVTEGKVQVETIRPSAESNPPAHELSRVIAGQHATIRPGADDSGDPSVTIKELSGGELDQALAWQTLRLEFAELPLHEVIEEFNRFNHRKLVIEDEATRAIKVGGSFRPDSIEPFVRVLELGFGVASEVRGDEIVLRQRR